MSRRPIAVVSALILVGTMAGCSLISGPVTMGGSDTSELCVSATPGHQLLVGDFITTPAGADVVVRHVELFEAEGIIVERAWLAPPLDGAMGSANYPPEPSPAWDARVDAEGAAASEGDNNVILLLERADDGVATATAVQVDYSAGGIDYSVHGSMRITMKDDCIAGDDPDAIS